MKIEKSECNYQVTECDLKFGKQITLDGELLVPISVLNKIRSEIEQTAFKGVDGEKFIFVRRVNQIIDKYKSESEGEHEMS